MGERARTVLGWLVLAVGVSTFRPAWAEEPLDAHHRACGLPEDYAPPPSAPIPEEEQVPGVIGLGAMPYIGCPPAPPRPGEPDVEAVDFRFEGTPYKEPNRRVVRWQLAPIRACYASAGQGEVQIELVAGSDGRVRALRMKGAESLRRCIEPAVRELSFYVAAPAGARIAYRYRVRG